MSTLAANLTELFCYGDFIEGKAVFFNIPGAVAVRFQDDIWHLVDLLRGIENRSDAKIDFSKLPVWLRFDVKRYIASHWRERGTSMGHMRHMVQSLGHLGKALPDFSDRPLDLQRDPHGRIVRDYIIGLAEAGYLKPSTVVTITGNLNAFFVWLRLETEETRSDFVVTVPTRIRQIAAPGVLEENVPKVIPWPIIVAILDACGRDEVAYEASLNHKAAGGKFPRAGTYPCVLLTRAICAQAVKLAICVGRRAGAIVSLPRDPVVEDRVLEGQRIVTIRFKEMKIRNIDEDVVCPHDFGEIALDAIRKVQRYGEVLRASTPRYAQYLFPVPGRGHTLDRATMLKRCTLNAYINGLGSGARHCPGLLDRYNIADPSRAGAHITTHNFRATRATALSVGGMAAHEIAQDLGHANSDMTLRHYIVGTPEVVRMTEEALIAGAVSGEAIEVLTRGRPLGERISSRMVEQLKNRKLVVLNVTRYGCCLLPAESGDCPTANKCWEGINPEAPAARVGEGCEWQVLTPAAVTALREDETTIVHQIDVYGSDPGYAHFMAKLRQKLEIVRIQIAKAEQHKAAMKGLTNGDALQSASEPSQTAS